MKQVIKLSLLCSALWLAGCGDETNSSGASTEVVYESYIQQALQRDTTIKFALSGKDANVPLPSFALMNAKDGTLKFRQEAILLALTHWSRWDKWMAGPSLCRCSSILKVQV